MILTSVDKNLNRMMVVKYKQPKNWSREEIVNTVSEILSYGFIQRIELDISDLKGIKYYRAVPQTDLLSTRELKKILKRKEKVILNRR